MRVDLAAHALSIAQKARERDLSDKKRNRELMPLSAAFIDSFTEVFGRCPAGRFTENGRTVEWGRK